MLSPHLTYLISSNPFLAGLGGGKASILACILIASVGLSRWMAFSLTSLSSLSTTSSQQQMRLYMRLQSFLRQNQPQWSYNQ